MSLLTTLPMALIPLFGVGLSGASHIVAHFCAQRAYVSSGTLAHDSPASLPPRATLPAVAQLRRAQTRLHDHALGELPSRCLNARDSAEALP